MLLHKGKLVRTSARVLVLVLLIIPTLAAQTASDRLTPGRERFRLAYFEGTWTLQGDVKPGPLGPGGKFTETEHNEWMQGNFFLISHADFKGSMGAGTGLTILGFDTTEKGFTLDSYNSLGEAQHAKGTLAHGVWTFTFVETMAGKKVEEHFIINEVSPTSYTFKLETGPENGPFSTAMEGTATKQK